MGLKEELLSSKPYLFNLADQLVTHFPERQWDALFVDDTNARLPARFLRKVLEDSSSRSLPMYFVQSGRLARGRVPKEKYFEYMHFIAGSLPPKKLDFSQKRALVVSESAGTFETAKFLLDITSAEFDETDFAIVASRSSAINLDTNVYIGIYGKEITRIIGQTFEGAKEKSLFYFGRKILPPSVRLKITRRFPQIVTESTQKMTGVKGSNNPYVAASRTENSARLAHLFRSRMNLLAQEYFMRKKAS